MRGPFEASLPVAGEAGTLADRLKGTRGGGYRPREDRVDVATCVRSLATCKTADDEPIVFSIIANNYGIPGAEVDRVADGILTRLASFAR